MAMNRAFLCFVTICLLSQQANSEFISKRLVDYIKASSDPDVIPQTFLYQAVNVTMSMTLIKIRNVDFTTKDVELDAWINFRWNGGVTFDPVEFDNLESVRVPISSIWRPDIEVFNGKMIQEQNGFTNYAVCSRDGEVLWVPKMRIRANCDVTRFNLVTNTTCNVLMGSWTYDQSNLSLGEDTSIDLSQYEVGTSFEILNASANRRVAYYACCPHAYESINFSFSFKKRFF